MKGMGRGKIYNQEEKELKREYNLLLFINKYKMRLYITIILHNIS